ncbi:MAG: type II toxin-antitoxin system PemK/MazF family toxin [Isosphaerales bacterium]
MASVPQPKRGEIWQVRFDPSIGAEIRKQRPAVVMNLDGIGKLPLRIVVPITDWQPAFASFSCQVTDVGRRRFDIDSAIPRSQNRLTSSMN